MDPLGSFGEFLTAMFPVQSVTATLRFYFKLREFVHEKQCIQFVIYLLDFAFLVFKPSPAWPILSSNSGLRSKLTVASSMLLNR